MFSRKTPTVAEMLRETQSETGAQLISSVLYHTSPPGPTGLPGLDVQLLSTSATRGSLTSSFNRGDVIEIQGSAASGKTRIVYNLVMQCILPHKIFLSSGDFSSEIVIGGWEKSAVVFDTDGRWSIRQLKSLLSKRLDTTFRTGQVVQEAPIDDLVVQCLQRLHIFRVKSSACLAATLFRLPTYHAQCMPTQEIALLSIDSISSFYWIDRYALEHQRQGPSDKRDVASPLNRILIVLQEIRLTYGLVTVLTNWGLSSLSKAHSTDVPTAEPSPFYRQHLYPFPAPFENPARLLPNAHLLPPITHHVTLLRSIVDQVPSEVSSLREAIEMTKRGSPGTRENGIKGIIRTVETGSMSSFTLDSYGEP